jgi:hypothetical protein
MERFVIFSNRIIRKGDSKKGSSERRRCCRSFGSQEVRIGCDEQSSSIHMARTRDD